MKKLSLGLALIFCLVFTLVGYKVSHKGTFALSAQQNILFDSNRTGNYEIYKLDSSGQTTQLTNDTTYDSWWPKPSPNGKAMIFYRTPKGIHDSDYTKTSLWAANIDGSNVHELIPNGGYGWVYQGHGEWSPDGAHLVVIGGPSGQLYITDAEGKNPAQINITGQSLGLSDPSYSPDGNTIVYAYQKHVWTVNKNGGTPIQISNDSYTDYDPYFSPNADQIAMLTHTSTNVGADWGIRLVNTNGSNLHWLINDGNINSKPNWSPDGSLIYFHRHPTGAGTGFFGLWVENVNGTGLSAVDAGGGSNEYPAIFTEQSTAQTNGGSSQQSTGKSGSAPTSSGMNTSTATKSGSSATTSKGNSTLPTTGSSSGIITTGSKTSAKAAQTTKAQKSSDRNLMLTIVIVFVLGLTGWLFYRWKKKAPIWR